MLINQEFAIYPIDHFAPEGIAQGESSAPPPPTARVLSQHRMVRRLMAVHLENVHGIRRREKQVAVVALELGGLVLRGISLCIEQIGQQPKSLRRAGQIDRAFAGIRRTRKNAQRSREGLVIREKVFDRVHDEVW